MSKKNSLSYTISQYKYITENVGQQAVFVPI